LSFFIHFFLNKKSFFRYEFLHSFNKKTMVCYQENDNIIPNRNQTRLEDVLFATRQEQPQQQRQEEEEDTDSMPELEWGSEHDVNPAEEDNVNDQNDNRQEHMWHYFAEQRNEEFYRRLEESASDYFRVYSFQLPDYIRRPNHLHQREQQEEEEEVIQEHHDDRVRYVNRRRPLLSNALYEHIGNNLFNN